MRAFMTASSLAISSETSGSGLAAGRAAAGAALFVVPVSLGNGSRKTATFVLSVLLASARNSAHSDQHRDPTQASGGRLKPLQVYTIELS